MIQHGPPAANTRARTNTHTHTHADKGVKLFTREEQTLNMCRGAAASSPPGVISTVSNHSNRHDETNFPTKRR